MTEQSKIVQENRIGAFDITKDLLFSESKPLMDAFLSKVLIVRCEHYYTGIFKYEAFSELFEPNEQNCEPPRYNIIFTRHGDGAIKAIARKLN